MRSPRLPLRRPWLAIAAMATFAWGPGAAASLGDDDGDGVPNRVEDVDGDGGVDDDDTDDDGIPDWRDPDDDGDGVDTRDEDDDGDGDPTSDDGDGDGEPDYLDRFWPKDKDHDTFVDVAWGGDDCDDTQLGVNPDAYDAWYDGEDRNCDGADDFDADGDGYRAEFGADGDDCNDLNADVHPAAEEDLELGDAPRVDRDCDGFTDPAYGLTTQGGCDCGAVGPPGIGLGAIVGLCVAARRRRR